MDKKMVIFLCLCLGVIFLFACNVVKTGMPIEKTAPSPITCDQYIKNGKIYQNKKEIRCPSDGDGSLCCDKCFKRCAQDTSVKGSIIAVGPYECFDIGEYEPCYYKEDIDDPICGHMGCKLRDDIDASELPVGTPDCDGVKKELCGVPNEDHTKNYNHCEWVCLEGIPQPG